MPPSCEVSHIFKCACFVLLNFQIIFLICLQIILKFFNINFFLFMYNFEELLRLIILKLLQILVERLKKKKKCIYIYPWPTTITLPGLLIFTEGKLGGQFSYIIKLSMKFGTAQLSSFKTCCSFETYGSYKTFLLSEFEFYNRINDYFFNKIF